MEMQQKFTEKEGNVKKKKKGLGMNEWSTMKSNIN